MPEQYWDAKAGTLKPEYGEHVQGLERFRTEIESLAGTIPEAADKYDVKLPADFEMPEGYQFSVEGREGLIEAARAAAHKARLPQSAFEAMVGAVAAAEIKQLEADRARIDAEIKALGEKGPERLRSIETALKARLTAGQAESLMALTVSKDGVEALEKLLSSASRVPAETADPARKGAALDQIMKESPVTRLTRIFERQRKAS
ncbi:MAG: hypothetical protein HXY25_06975 [Alphaproteobacteria bacterium]|nr:hypothetical protein [Alphaproteobacteria bacterium]